MASTSPGRSGLATMAFVTSSSSRRWSRSVESCRCVACASSKFSALSTATAPSFATSPRKSTSAAVYVTGSRLPKPSAPIRRRAVVSGRLQTLTMPCCWSSAMARGHRVSAAVSGSMSACCVSITQPEWFPWSGYSGRVVKPVPVVSRTRALVTPRSGWRRTRPRRSKRTTRRSWRARRRKSSSGSRQDVIDSAMASSAWKRSTRDRGPVEASRAAAAVSILLLEHRPTFTGHEQVVHVVGVLLLLRQDALEEHPGGRIPVAEVAHHLTVRLDGDALGDQVFLDHVDEVLALGVLRGGPGADAVRVQVRLAAELIDPLGEEIEMLLFLLRVLSELFLDRLAGEPGRADGVELVAEDADDLRGDRVVQEGDRVFHLAAVVLRHRAFAQMLPSPPPNLLDVRKKRPLSAHCLSSFFFSRPLRSFVDTIMMIRCQKRLPIHHRPP